MHTDQWQPPPNHLLCNDREVHIWQASLDASPDHLGFFAGLLSKDEIDRAYRFHFKKDHDRFIVARGTLRLILSRYLDQTPAEITFDYNRFGKPSLRSSRANTLRFNLSHANELALYAVSNAHEVGVDIEYIKSNRDAREIIERFFSENEKMEFQHLPEFMRIKAFYTGWTRKESFIKARGEGLSFPLEKFSVSLDPDQPAQLINIESDKKDSHEWMVKDVPVNDAYCAAVTVANPGLQFRYWDASCLAA